MKKLKRRIDIKLYEIDKFNNSKLLDSDFRIDELIKNNISKEDKEKMLKLLIEKSDELFFKLQEYLRYY